VPPLLWVGGWAAGWVWLPSGPGPGPGPLALLLLLLVALLGLGLGRDCSRDCSGLWALDCGLQFLFLVMRAVFCVLDGGVYIYIH
jgi:hypothetical protein